MTLEETHQRGGDPKMTPTPLEAALFYIECARKGDDPMVVALNLVAELRGLLAKEPPHA